MKNTKKINYVKETVSVYFDFDINIEIHVLDETAEGNEFLQETNAGAMTIEKDKYVLCVTTNSLSRVQMDQGFDLAVTLFHELIHILDIYKILNNKYYKFNPMMVVQKSLYDFVLKEGYSFWTEFLAYTYTYSVYGKECAHPTFLKLVCAYEVLEAEYKKVQDAMRNKDKELSKKIHYFLKKLRSLFMLWQNIWHIIL